MHCRFSTTLMPRCAPQVGDGRSQLHGTIRYAQHDVVHSATRIDGCSGPWWHACTGASERGICGAAGGDCIPNRGTCSCNPAALAYERSGPAGAAWGYRFAALVATLTDAKCGTAVLGMVPCYNSIVNNRYCRVATVVDASASDIAAWHSVARNNTETKC